jgi:cytochrome c-type biogenesis protein CcmH
VAEGARRPEPESPFSTASALGAILLVTLVALAGNAAARWPAPSAVAWEDRAKPVTGRDALERIVARYPRDGRAWMLLGMALVEDNQYADAAAAFERAIGASRRVAADPAVWCEYADALGMAQGGSLQGKPTELIRKALELRGDHPKALEMAGSAAYERRDFAQAATHWRKLLQQMNEGTTPHRELSTAIERAERLATTSLPAPR